MAETKNDLLSGEGSVQADPLGDGARERIRRGRKAKVSAGDSGAQPTPSMAQLSEAQRAELEKNVLLMEELYSPEGWERTACLPLDAAMMVTGAPEFEASDSERKTMRADFSLVIRFWAFQMDPKYLVLMRFATNYLAILGSHWIMYRTRIMKEAAEKAAQGVKA